MKLSLIGFNHLIRLPNDNEIAKPLQVKKCNSFFVPSPLCRKDYPQGFAANVAEWKTF